MLMASMTSSAVTPSGSGSGEASHAATTTDLSRAAMCSTLASARSVAMSLNERARALDLVGDEVCHGAQ
ncbi:hypothetical protein GCM10025876_08370 [Demequina litorisediminis]|uniref:Uncharacterized protein n=1 Tax=Demequina litorisediminis TaxID=1849022 RepID=A0ABQ6IC22_9MICO|nr:hypothetical protein GCM10025876_08370 [Demequina litorisediminis]